MLNIEQKQPLRKEVRRVVDPQIEADELQAWFDESVLKGSYEAFSTIVTLTPAMAAILLANNPANRPISKTNLARIKSDLLAGRWSFNGESIVISENGELNDGQHRCIGVTETGRSMRVNIVFGAPRESRLTIDQGTARTVGNYLSMEGVKNSDVVATVAKYIIQYREYGRVSTAKHEQPTKAQILDVATAVRGVSEAIAKFSTGRLPTDRSALAFSLWALSQRASDADVDAFFTSLLSGSNLDNGSPILYIRNRLIGSRDERLTANEKIELIFRCWNAHREGRSNTKFLPIMGGKLPLLNR